uniref:hypothetical protein n=2 Tax=Flavobacterium sp. TaxID=239 RepID=UPI00404B1333
MKAKILTLLCLAMSFLVNAQNSESIFSNFIGQSLKTVANNPDWSILVKTQGDLNKDGLDDFAIVLESKDSLLIQRCANCKRMKNKPRILLVVLNQNSQEIVTIQNNHFIARGDEGGMLPYLEPELAIENGLFTIFYQYTRSNTSYTFEYQNNNMIIVSASSVGVHNALGDFEDNQYDFKKGIITTETGNISQESSETKTTKIEVKPKSLAEFDEMYDWEVAENKFL